MHRVSESGPKHRGASLHCAAPCRGGFDLSGACGVPRQARQGPRAHVWRCAVRCHAQGRPHGQRRAGAGLAGGDIFNSLLVRLVASQQVRSRSPRVPMASMPLIPCAGIQMMVQSALSCNGHPPASRSTCHIVCSYGQGVVHGDALTTPYSACRMAPMHGHDGATRERLAEGSAAARQYLGATFAAICPGHAARSEAGAPGPGSYNTSAASTKNVPGVRLAPAIFSSMRALVRLPMQHG
jgi:hypothetical protein